MDVFCENILLVDDRKVKEGVMRVLRCNRRLLDGKSFHDKLSNLLEVIWVNDFFNIPAYEYEQALQKALKS